MFPGYMDSEFRVNDNRYMTKKDVKSNKHSYKKLFSYYKIS